MDNWGKFFTLMQVYYSQTRYVYGVCLSVCLCRLHIGKGVELVLEGEGDVWFVCLCLYAGKGVCISCVSVGCT